MRLGMMILVGLMPFAAFAHEFTAGDLKIWHPWTRATPAGSDMAAGYLTVTNTGKAADVLEGARVDGVQDVMVHSIRMDNGVAHMEDMAEGAVIQPGVTVALAPGGTHLMWMGLTRPLKVGEMVSGTLVFKRAGSVPVQFKVEAAGARAPAGEHRH